MPENNQRASAFQTQNQLPQVAIRMVRERPLLSEEPMNSPEAAIRVMNDFLSQMDRELVCIVNLQSDLKPISMNVVSMGALNESLVHPREIMKSAILSNAASFMLIHNHPSGSLKPSKEDIQITDRMQQVGNLMGIQLTDHIIIGRGQNYYSFHEKGIVEIKPIAYKTGLDEIHLPGKVAEVREQTAAYDADSNPVKNDRVQTSPLPVQGKDLESIMKSLEVGVQEFLDGDQDRYKDFLKIMSKFHSYSVNNTLLIAMQRPDATICNSYKRWQSLGRQVRRGEKGITIIAPAPLKQTKEREKLDQNQQPILDADGKPVMEEFHVTLPRFKPTTIFAYEQTEGDPLPFLIPEELTASVDNFDIFMEAIRKVSPVPIRFDEITSGAKGYYSNAMKEIVIQSGMSESQTMKTAVHETIHSMKHDRDLMKSLNVEKDRMTIEIEAESCAFCVCSAFNLDTSDYSFPYIGGWSKEHDTKELKNSLDEIRKTSGEFIDRMTEEMTAILEERNKEAEMDTKETEMDGKAAEKDTSAVEQDVVVTSDSPISFYVAECIEFPVLGEYHDGLTLEQAIEAYEQIPSDRMYGVKGIGFDLRDGSDYAGQYELFSNGRVNHESIDLVEYYRTNPQIQNAMHQLEKYAARNQQAAQEQNPAVKAAGDREKIADQMPTGRQGQESIRGNQERMTGQQDAGNRQLDGMSRQKVAATMQQEPVKPHRKREAMAL